MPKPAITRVSNLEITSSSTNKEKGFYTASLSTTQRDAITQTNGSLIFNSTTGTFQGLKGGAWNNINTSVSTATGQGLNGTPFIYPSGARVAVEVAGNQVNGFAYYDTTNSVLRSYENNAWVNL
mgnify:CR=1 FL=1